MGGRGRRAPRARPRRGRSRAAARRVPRGSRGALRGARGARARGVAARAQGGPQGALRSARSLKTLAVSAPGAGAGRRGERRGSARDARVGRKAAGERWADGAREGRASGLRGSARSARLVARWRKAAGAERRVARARGRQTLALRASVVRGLGPRGPARGAIVGARPGAWGGRGRAPPARNSRGPPEEAALGRRGGAAHSASSAETSRLAPRPRSGSRGARCGDLAGSLPPERGGVRGACRAGLLRPRARQAWPGGGGRSRRGGAGGRSSRGSVRRSRGRARPAGGSVPGGR